MSDATFERKSDLDKNEKNTIYSINGPVVKVRDTDDFSMLEMVYVGVKKLVGEVIAVNSEETTIQVYESTTGLKPGEPVSGSGMPMSATLGPGILSNIFDGIERPLRKLEEILATSSSFIPIPVSLIYAERYPLSEPYCCSQETPIST